MAPADSASGTGDRSVSLTTCNGTDASLPAMQLRARRRSAPFNEALAAEGGRVAKGGLRSDRSGLMAARISLVEKQIAAKGLARGRRTARCHRCTLGALCTRHCERDRPNNTADAWLCSATSPPISRKKPARGALRRRLRSRSSGLSATIKKCDLLITIIYS